MTDFRFINPHVQLFFDVKNDKGEVENWQAELTAPNKLARAGWDKHTLKPGDSITASGYVSKDDAHTMWINKLIGPRRRGAPPLRGITASGLGQTGCAVQRRRGGSSAHWLEQFDARNIRGAVPHGRSVRSDAGSTGESTQCAGQGCVSPRTRARSDRRLDDAQSARVKSWFYQLHFYERSAGVNALGRGQVQRSQSLQWGPVHS